MTAMIQSLFVNNSLLNVRDPGVPTNTYSSTRETQPHYSTSIKYPVFSQLETGRVSNLKRKSIKLAGVLVSSTSLFIIACPSLHRRFLELEIRNISRGGRKNVALGAANKTMTKPEVRSHLLPYVHHQPSQHAVVDWSVFGQRRKLLRYLPSPTRGDYSFQQGTPQRTQLEP